MATRSVPSVSASPGQLSITEIEVPARDETWVDANGNLSIGAGAPATIGDQNATFGALTLANAGGWKPIDSNGDEVDIVSITALSGTTSGWSVSSGRMIRSSTPATSNGATFTVDTALGSFVATIVTSAQGWSVKDIAELEAAAEHASLAYGDSILLRTGTYDNLPSFATIQRSAAMTGTFTPPTDHADADQGPDLDTANYTKITPHSGATPVITYLQIEGATNDAGGFRLTGLNFNRPNTPGVEITNPQSNPMLLLDGNVNNIAVDNCVFTQTASGDIVADVHAAIRISACDNIKIIDNEFYNTWDGISATGRHDGLDFIGNYMRGQNNDAAKFVGGDDIRVNWNNISDKKQPGPDSGAHVDYFQFAMDVLTYSPDNIRIIGNRMWRGDGSPPRESDPPGDPSEGLDGQGIFLDDLNSPYVITNLVIAGNTATINTPNGIYVTRGTAPVIVGNTILSDRNTESSANYDARIVLNICTDAIVEDNIANDFTEASTSGTTYANNIEASQAATSPTSTAYEELFDDPDFGPSVADVSVNFAIKTGSDADDADPKVGAAGTGYVNYTARTFSHPHFITEEFPVVAARATKADETTTTTHTANLPASISAGDRLLLCVSTSSASISTPSGWSLEATHQDASGVNTTAIFSKVADGSEGSTVAITIASNVRAVSIAHRITGAANIEAVFSADDVSDPPNLTPTWGSKKTLWITGFASRRSDWTLSAAPTGYADTQTAKNTSSTATSRVGLLTAEQNVEASSEDPATWTITGTVDNQCSFTIAVEPA